MKASITILKAVVTKLTRMKTSLLLIKTEIKALEEKLLHSDVRSNPELLNELLAEDFQEIGSSGMINSREDVVDWLLNKEGNVRWSLTSFNIRLLSDELVLAQYVAKKVDAVDAFKKDNHASCGSQRSSLWKKVPSQNNRECHWQMIFHQGTKILNNIKPSNG